MFSIFCLLRNLSVFVSVRVIFSLSVCSSEKCTLLKFGLEPKRGQREGEISD